MKYLARRIDCRRFSIGDNRRRRGRRGITRRVERRPLLLGELRVPIRPQLLLHPIPSARAADHTPPDEFITQQPLAPRSHALQSSQRHDQHIARFELWPIGQPHIGRPRRHAVWRRHTALVAARHQCKAALCRVFERPQHAHPLAETPAVLIVIGNARIARLVAALERRAGGTGLIAPDLRWPVENKSLSHNLIQIPHQRRVHQQIAEGLPGRPRPGQHPLVLSDLGDRPVEPIDLNPGQRPGDVQISGHVKAVILFIRHRFAVHSAPPVKAQRHITKSFLPAGKTQPDTDGVIAPRISRMYFDRSSGEIPRYSRSTPNPSGHSSYPAKRNASLALPPDIALKRIA